MAEPVSTVSIGLIKSLLALANKGELTLGALQNAATNANMSLGDLIWGIKAQQGVPGPTQGFANSLSSAIGGLPQTAQATIQNAVKDAARNTALQVVEKEGELIAQKGVKELAVKGAQMTKALIVRIATGIARLILGKTAGPIGSIITILVIGLIFWKLMGLLGDRAGDTPVEAGPRGPGRNDPPGSLTGSQTGTSLPGSGDARPSSPGLTGQIAPGSVNKKSFHGIWLRNVSVTNGISRVVFVQSGNAITARVEVAGAINGSDDKILLASGTYDLSGTIDDDNKMTFTMGKFTGNMSISPTGMTIYGFMNAPGGKHLGYSITLERQLEAKK